MPAQSPARLPRLIDVVAQCIVKLEVTRMKVLTSARNHGRSNWMCVPGHVRRPRPRVRLRVDDAVEEVDGEERAEEHDLRPDEEEDPDDRRVDPRAEVDRRRMLVRVAVAVARARWARRGRSRCGTSLGDDVVDRQPGLGAAAARSGRGAASRSGRTGTSRR